VRSPGLCNDQRTAPFVDMVVPDVEDAVNLGNVELTFICVRGGFGIA
jgi:hypothetical protein